MQISVTEAKGQLTELVRRAEAGDEVILTRHGHAAVRLVPVKAAQDRKSRRALLDAVASRPPQRPRLDRAPRAARISSTAMTAFQDDRRRYVGIDGDRAQ